MTDSIGSRLRQTREARHLTIEQVAEQTRIRPRYLQALESDDLSAIPSAVQARGFLRNYAEMLGLKFEELTAAPAQPAAPMAPPEPAPENPVPPQGEAPSRAGFLSGLRERFESRPAPATPAAKSSPAPAEQASAAPSEPFVPVRYHAELPAAPEPAAARPAAEPVTTRSRARKSSAKKPAQPSAENASAADKPAKTVTKKQLKKKMIASQSEAGSMPPKA
jgi:transcriptional regulator with XRE-family HTH domain